MDLQCSATITTSLSEMLRDGGTLSDDCAIVFDLDDTLYAERDFVLSGFRAIAQRYEPARQEDVFRQLSVAFDTGESDPFEVVLQKHPSPLEKSDLVSIYRKHQPQLRLLPEIGQLLQTILDTGRSLGLLTDGRSQTQRAKIESLGLLRWFTEIVISEEFGSSKPDTSNYQYFEHSLPATQHVYVGDNVAKDFVTPNQLGWTTIGLLDQGMNIHPQVLEKTPSSHLPNFWISSLA